MARIPSLPTLPIDARIPELLEVFSSHANLILQASPGSGKTTRVPPALLQAKFLDPQKNILVLVPRRLAARMAASRVAEELGEALGESVGYQFRFEKVLGAKTRLQFLTEGILLRRLLQDPQLKDAAAVILDEFHERHLHSDIALAYLRRLQKSSRPDLKIIVMSATLATEKLAEFLGQSPVLRLDSPVYPLEISYHPVDEANHWKSLAPAVTTAVSSLLGKIPDRARNKILVFLPGMAEILRCAEHLKSALGGRVEVLPLHGDLAMDQQRRVFAASQNPQVILATNIAESSLTIPGVFAVVDSGLQRQATFSWWNGIPTLKTGKISQASAIQRAGRAARTGAGLALRLYASADFGTRPAFDLPEIRRADLAPSLLEIKKLGIDDLEHFAWFEAPERERLQASVELMYRLGALQNPNFDASLTEIGERLVELPLHPRLGRILWEAEKRGVLARAIPLVAQISEGDFSEIDLLHAERPLSVAAKKMSEWIARFFPDLKRKETRAAGRVEENLSMSVLTGFPDHIAKKRDSDVSSKILARDYELVFASGGSALVPACPSVVEENFFVVLSVQALQNLGQKSQRLKVGALVPIPMEALLDLEPSGVVEEEEFFWDVKRQAVWEKSRWRYGQLVLTESLRKARPGAASEKIFLENILSPRLFLEPSLSDSECIAALEKIPAAAELVSVLLRLELWGRYDGEVKGHFEISKIAWGEIFKDRVAIAEIASHALLENFWNLFSSTMAGSLSRFFPEFLVLPKGRRIKINYELGKNPWVASRLQDFFGMKTSPTLLQGKIPLTLNLLAPNQRPVQVTSDLASFWKSTYPELRGALSRRYPRHAWPEKPL